MEDLIKDDIKDIRDHIRVLNDEHGQLVKCYNDVKQDIIQIRTDVDWLKRFFFIVATSSIGGLVVSVFSLIERN